MKKRVCVAMSGGVDSSVSAALLKEQGYDCIGMHLHFWTDPVESSEACGTKKNKCCTLDGLEDARRVCEFLDIPFYVMNVEKQFKEKVVDYFLEGYAKGETPNPCVECNRNIKFGDLWKRAQELGASFLASGHYARVVQNAETGEHELFMAADKTKDQSYFLYTLQPEILKSILFPIGEMKKTQVYEIAKKLGLPRVIEKPESQGLCFFAEGNPKNFLQRYLPSHFFGEGPIVTTDGRTVGKHRGLPLYTVGQRQGLGIGGISGEQEGEGWYIVSIDRERNQLVVGRKKDISTFRITCSRMNFISDISSGSEDVTVRIRHRGALVPAVLNKDGDRVFVQASEPFSAPCAGQSAVFYQGEKVLGGGVIQSASYYEEKEEITA